MEIHVIDTEEKELENGAHVYLFYTLGVYLILPGHTSGVVNTGSVWIPQVLLNLAPWCEKQTYFKAQDFDPSVV